jgi:HAD superfamily hydrolase (TIGR01549 family)
MEKYRSMRNMKNIKAVLFDLDGTLFFLPINYNKVRKRLMKLFNPFGIQSDFHPLLKSIEEALLKLKNIKSNGIILSENLVNDVNDVKEKAYKILDEEEVKSIEESEMVNEARDILNYLKKRNKKIAIISRNGNKCISRIFEKFEIEKPEVIVSRDDVEKMKPNREHVEVALNKLEVKNYEAIIVGDSIHDIELGINSGITTILVDYENKANVDIKKKADIVINSLNGIREIII